MLLCPYSILEAENVYCYKVQGHVNKNIAFLSTNPNMKYNGDHHISIIFCQITVHELYHLHKKDRSYFDSKLAELKVLCKASKEYSKKSSKKNAKKNAKKMSTRSKSCKITTILYTPWSAVGSLAISITACNLL